MDLGEIAPTHAEAVAAYREALSRSPDDALILNNLAYRLGKDPATQSEALAMGERAYQQAPQSGAVADTLGWILYQQGALERATRLLEQAAGSMPNNPEVHYHLGAAYAKGGKPVEARRALERALQTPRFAQVEQARKLLDSVR